MRRAVIDIGTNSVKLLVADVVADTVRPVLERSRQTRLGRGLYETHQLQPGPIAETVRVIARFREQAERLGALEVRAIATSAVRDAGNPGDLLAQTHAVTGLAIEVISGDQEAVWSFAGVMSDARLHDRPVLLLDVGGGSTEFMLGRAHDLRFRASYPLGVVRLLEGLRPAEPPLKDDLLRGRRRVNDFLAQQVAPGLRPALLAAAGDGPIQLLGTGGTATILAAMALGLVHFDREALEGYCLSRRDLEARLDQLWSLPIDRRRELPGLPPERADVMLTGTLIYTTVMEGFGFDSLRVTTRGLRHAAALDLAAPRPPDRNAG